MVKDMPVFFHLLVVEHFQEPWSSWEDYKEEDMFKLPFELLFS